jgi:hypothetical protein
MFSDQEKENWAMPVEPVLPELSQSGDSPTSCPAARDLFEEYIVLFIRVE